MFPENTVFKIFCSYPSLDGRGGNCSNEAVGEMAVYLDNNAKGDGIMHLPICQIHVDLLDKHHKT